MVLRNNNTVKPFWSKKLYGWGRTVDGNFRWQYKDLVACL